MIAKIKVAYVISKQYFNLPFVLLMSCNVIVFNVLSSVTVRKPTYCMYILSTVIYYILNFFFCVIVIRLD